ncbi:tyrosine-type recombinase/integrase [Nocardia sp. NPDC046473]|uniref:tyrosine-type recombinase/integrase n=1 Tax=Nocardia sp. NPDC046473 TaxID=3155733 RepID=UPI0033CD2B6F
MAEPDTKNHPTPTVPVPRILVKELAKLLEGRVLDELVFPSHKGGYLTSTEFRWVFDQAAATVGLKGVVPHALRYTAASLAISAGANIKVVQRMLGHKTATLTLDLYGNPPTHATTTRGFGGRSPAERGLGVAPPV